MNRGQAIIFACFALLCKGALSAKDDGDEGNPYEFGFTIDGEQHRHESRDVNGIIQGEFGFITGDGIYHTTVYATDENGSFKILSMRSVRVSPPLDQLEGGKIPSHNAQKQNYNTPTVQNNPSTALRPVASTGLKHPQGPPSTTARPPYAFTTQPTIKPACGGCGVPRPTTKKPEGLPFQNPQFQNPQKQNHPTQNHQNENHQNQNHQNQHHLSQNSQFQNPQFQNPQYQNTHQNPGSPSLPSGNPSVNSPSTNLLPPAPNGHVLSNRGNVQSVLHNNPPAIGVVNQPGGFPPQGDNPGHPSYQNPGPIGSLNQNPAPIGQVQSNYPHPNQGRPNPSSGSNQNLPPVGQNPSYGNPGISTYPNQASSGHPGAGPGFNKDAPVGQFPSLSTGVIGGNPIREQPNSGRPSSIFVANSGNSGLPGNPGIAANPGPTASGQGHPNNPGPLSNRFDDGNIGGSKPSLTQNHGSVGNFVSNPGFASNPGITSNPGFASNPGISSNPGIVSNPGIANPAIGLNLNQGNSISNTNSNLHKVTVSNGVINVPNNPPIPIVDKYPGMSDGLPEGVKETNVLDLLYKFNYTVGFHGHYEKGLKNGAKVGGYFVNGRDGISRVVTYIADENGYRPKFKLINLGLDSADTPKADTEKTFGLKNFEFVWYPVT